MSAAGCKSLKLRKHSVIITLQFSLRDFLNFLYANGNWNFKPTGWDFQNSELIIQSLIYTLMHYLTVDVIGVIFFCNISEPRCIQMAIFSKLQSFTRVNSTMLSRYPVTGFWGYCVPQGNHGVTNYIKHK